MDEQTPPAAAAAALPDAAARAERLAALLRGWTADCVHNSPLARDVGALNHLTQTALPELARRLLKEFG